MTYRPAKTRPRRRKRDDDLDQARLDFGPRQGQSELDREVEVAAEKQLREPLPGQAGLPWEGKA